MEKINIFKRKRLNNKGFTLIELLAVVVILAIVMGIAATSVLNSINNSRRSSLYSAAQNAANQINTWAAEDALEQTDNQRKLGNAFEEQVKGTTTNGGWLCLSSLNIQNKSGSTTTTSLLTALGISDNDILLGNIAQTYNTNAKKTNAPTQTENNGVYSGSCSAIRYNKSAAAYEIVLNAKKNGKYYVTSDPAHYAFSRATKENSGIND